MGNKSKIPDRARYDLATRKAYEFLEENLVYALPVDPFKICDLMDVTLMSYSEIALEQKISITEVTNFLQSSDGVAIYKNGQYFIFYNDTFASSGRVRFTIFHELGHIYLEHLTDFDKTSLNRNELTNDEYKVLENEANCFARNVLAPLPVILSQEDLKQEIVEELCDVSPTAAKMRLNFMKSDLYYLTNSSFEYMKAYFSGHIFNLNNTYACMYCGTITIYKNPLCCRICGLRDLVRTKYTLGVDKFMIYSEVELNANSQPFSCPKCKNDKLEQGNFCQICGLYTYNKCTGLYPGEYDDYHGPINWHSNESGCGARLSGDSRFCTDCGSTSSYAEDGILSYWENEKEEEERMIEAALDIPF